VQWKLPFHGLKLSIAQPMVAQKGVLRASSMEWLSWDLAVALDKSCRTPLCDLSNC
jgi:hypothetical protein